MVHAFFLSKLFLCETLPMYVLLKLSSIQNEIPHKRNMLKYDVKQKRRVGCCTAAIAPS